MPLVTILAAGLSLTLLLLDPTDWVGETKGALAVLVPLILYLLQQRRSRRLKQEKEELHNSESYLKFSSDREKRLEERESRLRQEERDFMHRQIELSRRRGHVLARGYMAFEMANAQLIKLLQDKQIEVPPVLFVTGAREQVLGELKEIEEEEARYSMEEG